MGYVRKAWVNYAYKPAWQADAGNHIRKRLRTQLYYRKNNLFRNFKKNMAYKLTHHKYVGWSAPQAIGAKAQRAQYKWRNAYWKAHGRVI